MNSDAVILLGVPLRNRLAETLLAAGYTPLERVGMQRTITTLRREQVAGVLVDVRKCELDVLELLLNIGDVCPGLPVGLIANRASLDRSPAMVEGFPNVVMFSESLPAEKVVDGLCRFFDSRRQPTQSSRGNL